MSQKNEDVTTESLIKNLLEKIERLESHLVDYQGKVRNTLADSLD
ncbi:MAG: hypothetical protein ABSB56_03735 [Nitrososphaerales archaeon]